MLYPLSYEGWCARGLVGPDAKCAVHRRFDATVDQHGGRDSHVDEGSVVVVVVDVVVLDEVLDGGVVVLVVVVGGVVVVVDVVVVVGAAVEGGDVVVGGGVVVVDGGRVVAGLTVVVGGDVDVVVDDELDDDLLDVLDVEVVPPGRVAGGCSVGEGGANPATGSPSWAAAITSCQMRAGIEPPVTVRKPAMSRIGMLPAGSPTHTAAASCGV